MVAQVQLILRQAGRHRSTRQFQVTRATHTVVDLCHAFAALGDQPVEMRQHGRGNASAKLDDLLDRAGFPAKDVGTQQTLELQHRFNA